MTAQKNLAYQNLLSKLNREPYLKVGENLKPFLKLPEREQDALFSWLTTFYPFQLQWLLESSSHAISNKARQIGLSHTTSAVSLIWGAYLGELTTIISVGEKESREVLDKVRKHAYVLRNLGSTMALPGRTDNAEEMSFASGGRIMALPSSGGRGFTGNVFLDEFAYQEHAKKVWDAASSVTNLGKRLRVASTPNGMGNEFHNLWKVAARDPVWKRYEYSISLAESEGFPVDRAKLFANARSDQRVFDQLYNCKFLDGELQYIPSELMEPCATDELPFTVDGPCFAGLDIGKSADLTVLTVVQKCNGLYVVKHIQCHKRTDSDGLEQMVASAFERFKLRRLCVDATGMGAFPAERMRKRHGLSKVEPIVFTLQVKEDLATALYTVFTEQTIRIPKTKLPGCLAEEPAKLMDDIASLQRKITTAGNVRYDAPHTNEGHADRAWSLAMALHAAMTAPSYARMS